MSTHTPEVDTRQIIGWRNAVFTVFFACGLSLASFMARVPHVRDLLGASTAQMSLLTFVIALGSIIGMSSSSAVIDRVGARRAILVCGTIFPIGLLLTGFGVAAVSFPFIAAGLLVFGLGFGTCDVAMNLNGAAQETVSGQTIMPIFHALFSVGTMVGAGLGAVAEIIALPVVGHLGVISVIILAGVWFSNRWLLSETLAHADEDAEQPVSKPNRRAVWAQPATLLIGLVALGMALTEGSANDWLALAMVDGHGVSNATGAIALGLFLTAMTVTRVLGVRLLDRFGRVVTLRAGAVSAAVGLAVVIFTPITALAYVGIVLWGFGAALGFPVAMSAAAEGPNSSARVSAVAMVGYLAFLGGPPLIGFLGEQVGLLKALLVVLVAITLAGVVASAVREPRTPSTSGPVTELR